MDVRLPLFCVAHFLRTLAMYIPLDFLPDLMMKEHGIPHIEAGNVVPIYGIASIVGRLVSGVVAYRFKNRAVLLSSLCMVVQGASCVGMAYSNVYWQFAVCDGFYGFFHGYVTVLLPLSLVEMFGIASLKDSYAVIMFFCGISTRFGLPLVGWIEVEWGSYSLAFLITGAIYFVGGLHCVYCLLHVYIKEKLFKSENVA